MKIGRVQKLSRSTTIDCQTFIDRSMRQRIRIRDNRHYWVASERRDCAVLTGKDKPRWTRPGTVVYYKAIAAVKNEARWIPLRTASAGNRKGCLNGVSADVEQRGFASAVIGKPPG